MCPESVILFLATIPFFFLAGFQEKFNHMKLQLWLNLLNAYISIRFA